jgi:hypothetical protein
MDLDKKKIPKSEWVEHILPALNYKNVLLIEVPVLQSQDFKAVITEMDNAWKKFSMGQYKEVMVHCRNALDGSATIVKEAEFVIVDEGRPVADWKRFFGDDEIGEKVEKIFRSTRALTAPGAHIGKMMGIDEFNFVLFQTYSIVKYVISRFQEIQTNTE